MFRLRVVATAVCVLMVGAIFVRAQDAAELKALLRKAIEAHGGEKNLAKYKAAVTKFKGTLEVQNLKFDVTGETSVQKPDKVKNIMMLDLNGKQIDVVTVFNGKNLWVSTMGKTMEITDEKILNAAREEMQTEGASGLSDFLKEPYELSALGETKVKDKAAIGIRVSKKGQKDFSIFIDKQTHLIVKTEARSLDAQSGQEVLQEKFIIGYQDKGGLKLAKRVEILKDGKAFMDIEILETQAFEKLDDAHFAKP
jgi:negative regulator of sigma E activity